MKRIIAILALGALPLVGACSPRTGMPTLPSTTTRSAPMECDGDPFDVLHCSAAGGETVCDTEPELCEP